MKCIHHKEPNRMTKELKKGNNPQTCELKTCQKWIWSSSMENHYKRAHPQIPVPRKHINTKEIIGNAQQELYEFQKNKKPKKQNGGAKRKQPQKKRKRKIKIKVKH